ncbi:MAG TPA: hypothetical protein VL096_21225, partial [Pirellulaceae bacterium]|nr:hypothetical protein [Pirellulaceae bacterium]
YQGPKSRTRHSVNFMGDGSGESDLEAVFDGLYSHERGRLLLLIEDKIDARFTEQQPERYQRRCEILRINGNYELSSTVLIAPLAYLQNAGTTCFGATISYEDILDFLAREQINSDEERRLRREHRSFMLRHAIERYRRGGQRLNDEQRTTFFDDYFQAAQQRHSQLRQKPARQRSAASRGFFFELYPRIQRGVEELYMEHQLDRGSVRIYFRGWGKRRDWYLPKVAQIVSHPQMRADAPPDRQFVSVSIEGLPRLDLSKPLADQMMPACAGFDAAAELLAWYQTHQPLLEQWASQS